MSDKTLGLQLHGFLQKQQIPQETGDKSNGAETPAKEDEMDLQEMFEKAQKAQSSINAKNEQQSAAILDALQELKGAKGPSMADIMSAMKAAQSGNREAESWLTAVMATPGKGGKKAKKAAMKSARGLAKSEVKRFDIMAQAGAREGIDLTRYKPSVAANLAGVKVAPVDTRTGWVRTSDAFETGFGVAAGALAAVGLGLAVKASIDYFTGASVITTTGT